MTRFGSLAATIVAQAEARAAEQQSPGRGLPARDLRTASAVRGENDGRQFQRKERV